MCGALVGTLCNKKESPTTTSSGEVADHREAASTPPSRCPGPVTPLEERTHGAIVMLPAVRLPAVALLAAASTLPTTSAIGPRIASQEEILEMADEWCAITSITLVTRFVGTLCWLDLAGSTTLMRTRMANLISLNYRRCSRSSRKALR